MTDDYTKALLERAKERSKMLGLATAPKSPLTVNNSRENKTTEMKMKQALAASPKKQQFSQSPRKSGLSSYSPKKVSKMTYDRMDMKAGTTTTVSNNVNKEDADVAVEVNITSKENIQVEVEVAEYEMDDDGNVLRKLETKSFESAANLRDSSRKNLKRLEALYSENEQVASPIQRTEEKFCADDHTDGRGRPVKKFSKLAALANNINSWEDDYTHHNIAPPTTAPTVRGAIPKTTVNMGTRKTPEKSVPSKNTDSPIRNLMWDKKVMDSLEAQGYTRRESTVPKLIYDYKEKPSTSQTFVPKSTLAGSPAKTAPAKGVGSPVRNVSSPANNCGSPAKNFSSPAKTFGSPARTANSPAKNFNSPAKSFNSAAAKSKPATPQKTIMKTVTDSKSTTPSKKVDTPTKSVTFSNSVKGQKDPAEMSLKERMAIFEKNKGAAPVPKCRFGLAETATFNAGEGTSKSVLGDLSQKITNFQTHVADKKTKEMESAGSSNSNVKGAVTRLFGNKEMTISEKQISEEIKKQKQQDMEVVLKRFQAPPQAETKRTPEKVQQVQMEEDESEEEEEVEVRPNKRRSTEQKPMPEHKNPEVFQKPDDIKRVRVSQSRLYPILSDIESTDSEMDNYTTATVSGTESGTEGAYHVYSETSTRVCTTNDEDQYSSEEETRLSLGREILRSVQENEGPTLNRSYLDSTASSEDISGVMDEMDQYLDEALENDISGQTDKSDERSESFIFNSYSKKMVRKSVSGARKSTTNVEPTTPVTSKLEITPPEDDGKVTLVHTVSFYRRQQSQSSNNTPARKVVYKNMDDSDDDDENPASVEHERRMKEMADEKIKRLLNEVCKQQTIISQTSQALNLCASTIEFSGSTEAVEGERHLLVATHRRLACLNEIQRLKVEGLLDRQAAGIERGTLTVSDIIVPLKPTYVNKLASDEINGHHLVCLLKYNEHVLATKSVPTLPGLKSVRFPDTLTLNEVYSDFKITLEVYGMTAQREILPHDIKYHITPGKKKHYRKGHESNLIMPPVSSPGGPNAVRTPALCHYGYIIFSIREIKQKSWVINEVAPGVSPLNGNVFLKIDSKITVDVDHSGFLNMFDEISGFGAWHRRWCRLSGNSIYFWKYPEDERRKEPIGKLELSNCITEKVNLAPRNICARLHTLLLEFRRPRQEADQESLIMVPKGDYTVVRQLLAADTKEDREDWCTHLNKALALMKSWGTQV